MGVSDLDGSNGASGDKTATQPSVDSTRSAPSIPDSGSSFPFSSAGRMPCDWVVR